MAEIEHHWHDPSQGQVIKAMYQYLADIGIGKEQLMKMVDDKIRDALSDKISSLLNSQRFDALIVAAVADYIKNEKAVYNRDGGYGLVNRIRDLIQQELQRTILQEYQVTVAPKKQ